MASIEGSTLLEKLTEINEIKEQIRQEIINTGGGAYLNNNSPFSDFPTAIHDSHTDLMFCCTALETIVYGTDVNEILLDSNKLTYQDTYPYLTQLNTDKTTLANNIRTMGVPCEYNEPFSDLANKVLEIPQVTPPAPAEPFKYITIMPDNFTLMQTGVVTKTIKLVIEPDSTQDDHVKIYGFLDKTIPTYVGNTTVSIFIHSIKTTYDNSGNPVTERKSHVILDKAVTDSGESTPFEIEHNWADLPAYEDFYNVKNNGIYNYYDLYTYGQGLMYYYPMSYFNSEYSDSSFIKVAYYNIYEVQSSQLYQLSDSNMYWVYSNVDYYGQYPLYLGYLIYVVNNGTDYPLSDAFTSGMGLVGIRSGEKTWSYLPKEGLNNKNIIQFAITSDEVIAVNEAKEQGQTALYNKIKELQTKYMPEIIYRGTLSDKLEIEWVSIRMTSSDTKATSGKLFPKLLNGTASVRIKIYVHQKNGQTRTKTLTCNGASFTLPDSVDIDHIELEEV